MCFKTYLNHPINQKTSQKKKNLRAITVFKKEGGGPARYDHDHRFNGFFFKPSLNWCRDYSTLWHCRNRNQTSKSPQISTRRRQTPFEGIGALCHKCHPQEVFDGFHLSGKIEWIQRPVYRQLYHWNISDYIKKIQSFTNFYNCKRVKLLQNTLLTYPTELQIH